MRKIMFAAAAALFAVSIQAPTQAQDLRPLDSVNMFISPCGEPFTALKKEPYPIVKWFNLADANHDGKLDIDEMRADAARFFKLLDRNGDGVLDGAEISFYESRIVPEILAPPDAALETGIIRVALQGIGSIAPGAQDSGSDFHKGELNPNQGAVYYSLFREPEPVRAADRNFDYRVTLQEFLAHSDRHFKALDTTNRGYLILADLPKTDAEKRARAHR